MSTRLIYLETSALVKLVALEGESEVLRNFLLDYPAPVTSSFARLEVPRILHAVRASSAFHSRAERVLDRLTFLELDTALLGQAAAIEPFDLAPGHAVHLAAAQLLGDDLAYFVSYDPALVAAARALQIDTISPGAAG